MAGTAASEYSSEARARRSGVEGGAEWRAASRFVVGGWCLVNASAVLSKRINMLVVRTK
jgi:hypothetical protein